MESMLSKLEKSRTVPSSRQHETAPPPKRPSPPDPKPKPVWDQSTPYILPAGRRSRAERRVDLLVSYSDMYPELSCLYLSHL